jgi:SLOG cluster4 family
MPTDQPSIAPNAGAFDFDNNPTWRVLRIMSEFVEGFTFLARIRKNVTIFGSARVETTHPYYQLAERGFTIVTGGGPGIMQAGNQGAVEGNGLSVGADHPYRQRFLESLNFLAGEYAAQAGAYDCARRSGHLDAY